jgi:hypothetical protein
LTIARSATEDVRLVVADPEGDVVRELDAPVIVEVAVVVA